MKRSEIVKKFVGHQNLLIELQVWLDNVEANIFGCYEFPPLTFAHLRDDGIKIEVVSIDDPYDYMTEKFTLEELDMEPLEYFRLREKRKKKAKKLIMEENKRDERNQEEKQLEMKERREIYEKLKEEFEGDE